MGEVDDIVKHARQLQQLQDVNNQLVAENNKLRGRPGWFWVIISLVSGALAGGKLGDTRALRHAAAVCGAECTAILQAENNGETAKAAATDP
jgi:hypothetical protein